MTIASQIILIAEPDGADLLCTGFLYSVHLIVVILIRNYFLIINLGRCNVMSFVIVPGDKPLPYK